MANGKTVQIEKKSLKKDSANWEKFEKLIFSGPKTDCVKDIDLIQ